MNEESIFEVSREEYKHFVETINPKARYVEEVELNRFSKATKIMSKKREVCLGSRVSYTNDTPEKYYIFELPNKEELNSNPPVPKVKVILETKEQVQKLLDFLKENEPIK